MIQQITTAQSIARILTTPLITRVNLPDYGSRLFELIDKSVDDEWILDATRYTYEAIEISEPRADIKKVLISTGDIVNITIKYEEDGTEKTINLDFAEVENVNP